MYSDCITKKFDSFTSNTDKSNLSDEYLKLCFDIYVVIRRNLVNEIYFYMYKIKNGKNLVIDEIINPLECAIKVYSNFEKYFGSFPIKKLNIIYNCLLNNENNFDEKMKKLNEISPILFSDISIDTFIKAFEENNVSFLKFNVYKKQHNDTKDIDVDYFIAKNLKTR